MTELDEKQRRVLYLVVCAAPPAWHIQDFIKLAQATAWDVCTIVTPQATKFTNIAQLAQLTGYPARSEYRFPGEPGKLPKADAIAVVPATFNTINKWAQGIANTFALSILCESLAWHIPIIAVPCLNPELAYHPAFPTSVAFLRDCGIHILYEPEKYPPLNAMPWNTILNELQSAIEQR